jgi:type II secretory pathway pseudopilin PulG
MATTARRGDPRGGFLLVEALAALALGALILTALLSLTGILRRSADRAAASVETMEVSGRTLATVAGEIRRASRRRWAAEPGESGTGGSPPRPPAGGQPRTGPQSGEAEPAGEGQSAGEGGGGLSEAQARRPFVFSGAPDRVLFALTPEQASGLRAPVLVAYQIDASGAVLRAEAALPADATGPGSVRLGPVSRIDPGPERLRFAFVDRRPDGGEVIVDAWSDPLRMPAAVRIDRTDAATGAPLGALRAPLLLDGEPGCADPQKGFCSRVAKAPRDGAARAGRPGEAPAPNATREQE